MHLWVCAIKKRTVRSPLAVFLFILKLHVFLLTSHLNNPRVSYAVSVDRKTHRALGERNNQLWANKERPQNE